MASFKVRRKALLQGGQQIGADGSDVTTLIMGQYSACVEAITASGDVSTGSIAVSGLPDGAFVFVQPAAGDTGAVYCYAASATADDTVSASFASTTGSAVAAYTGTFNVIGLA